MKLTWNAALEESEMVMYETVHKLFKQTGFTADDVRALSRGCALVELAIRAHGLHDVLWLLGVQVYMPWQCNLLQDQRFGACKTACRTLICCKPKA